MVSPGSLDGWLTITTSTVPYLPASAALYLSAPADGTLAIYGWGDAGIIRTLQPAEWQFLSSESVPLTVRKTPTWAIIMGIIGLFVFLIGLVFFFVKQNVTEMKQGVTISTSDGQFSGIRGAGGPPKALIAATRSRPPGSQS
jgi:hypothetical protein